MKRPSQFLTLPRESVLHDEEAEAIALAVMVCLVREGNRFKELSWDTYKKHRLLDGNFNETKERPLFDTVIAHTISAETAKDFSPVWRRLYEEIK